MTLLAALAGAACARPAPPGVDALVVQTDLAFGAKPVAAPAASPPPDSVFQDTTLPSLPPLDALAPLRPPTGTVSLAPSVCPTAGLNDFPAEPAARTVSGGRRPVPGAYRWKRTGTLHDPTFGALPIAGFESREIRNFVELAPTTTSNGDQAPSFRFDTIQTDITTGAIVVRTWQVKTGGTSVGTGDVIVAPPTVTVPGSPTTATPPGDARTGDPDRGLALVKQQTIPKQGAPVSFNPATPLLVMPLPARAGEEFNSAAVDPATFESMSYSNAQVGPPARVDACGTLVEGWPVSGAFQFVGPSGATSSFTYSLVVVPQLGAIPASETIAQTAQGTGIDATWTIAKLKPEPLASGER